MPETQASSPTGRVRPPPDILDRIVESKWVECEALKKESAELWARAREAPPARDFEGALTRAGEVALIAELKRRSPGAGDIRADLDVAELAAGYARAGAAAISVLTDREYFGGSLTDLERVRAVAELPVLRKDFTLVPDQVAQARAGGADAVLLIARILSQSQLVELSDVAHELGLAALVEVHDADELGRALSGGARIIGINNRDLTRFVTDLGTTLELLPDVAGDRIIVSESGIRSQADVDRLGAAGVDAILVGEALLSAADPADAARGLAGRPRRARAS